MPKIKDITNLRCLLGRTLADYDNREWAIRILNVGAIAVDADCQARSARDCIGSREPMSVSLDFQDLFVALGHIPPGHAATVDGHANPQNIGTDFGCYCEVRRIGGILNCAAIGIDRRIAIEIWHRPDGNTTASNE
jgi:hypothetical protein